MRMKEELRKSGKFWLPASPAHSVSGTLFISDGGRIELEILGELEPPKTFIYAINSNRHPERINGYIESFGEVTLIGCFYRKRNFTFPRQISKSRIHAHKVLLGAWYGEDELLLFNTLDSLLKG